MVRIQDQSVTALSEFNAVAARFPDVQEESLVNGVFIRPVFDVDTFFEEEVGGFQNIFTGVGRKRQVVEPAAFTGPVIGVHDVVGFLRETEPSNSVTNRNKLNMLH